MYRQSSSWVLVTLAIFGSGHNTVQAVQMARCTGTVVDAQGRPIAGAKVRAFEMLSDGLAGNITLEKVGELVTRDDGTFAFAVPSRPATGTRFMGGYTVAAKNGCALGWALWNMREDVAATITLGEPNTATGWVADEVGQPIVDAHVRANLLRMRTTSEGEEKQEWLPGLVLPDRLETRTDSKGRFAFDHLPRDTRVDYLIMAAGRATTYTDEPAQDAQTRASRGQTNAPFVLPKEGRISGRILDPDTNAGVSGARFAVVPTFSGLFYYRLIGTADAEGTFSVGGLIAGKYVIRGNGIPRTYAEVRSGETARVTIRADQAWYGRILFQDGEPAVMKPPPWPGAATTVFLAEDEQARGELVGQLDDDGYFRVYLSQEQYQKLQLAQAWFHVRLPDRYDPATKSRSLREETVFAVGLLARDKARAGAARIARPGRERTSLVNQALPALAPLGLDLSRRAEGKMVLLCWLDMQQRPSRNCLQQLAARASELQAKGVVIAAAQASRVDPADLCRWMTENNISFPVGMIQGDEEKITLLWALPSLPWLILTDGKGVVAAEGFSLAELDTKIDEVSGR